MTICQLFYLNSMAPGHCYAKMVLGDLLEEQKHCSSELVLWPPLIRLLLSETVLSPILPALVWEVTILTPVF